MTTTTTRLEDLVNKKKQRTRSKKGKSKVKEINLSDILTTMQANNASAQALELDCRLAQLMSSLNSLMELRERILRAPEGIYTHDDLMEVNEDIEHVRAKRGRDRKSVV